MENKKIQGNNLFQIEKIQSNNRLYIVPAPDVGRVQGLRDRVQGTEHGGYVISRGRHRQALHHATHA